MATVVQATEHLIVESATAVVTQVAKSTAGDLKEIESNVAKEAVSATDEGVPSLLDKVQDGLQDVATEVMKGAESAVEAVEQHPELIAEGALAVAIGAASLVQPELVAGEVALIGKMAADSVKKTVTTIATDTSSKVVKAISKDLADDAKEEAAKDAAAAATKEKAEGGEKGKEVTKEAADPKAAAAQPAKDVPNGTAPTTTNAKTSSASDAALVEAVKEATKGSATSVSDTKVDPAKANTVKDRTIAIQVAQEPSKVTTGSEASSLDPNSDTSAAAPVSLKITLGADGEVKAVTKDANEERPKVADPAPETVQVASKTSSVETETKPAVVSTEATNDKPDVAQEAPASVPQPPTISEKKSEEASEPLKAIDDSPTLSSPTVVSAVATVTSTTKTKTISKPVTEDGMVTMSQESVNLLHQKLDTMQEAIQQITKVLALHLLTPTSAAAASNAIKSTEEEINEALVSAVKPLTGLLPDILPNNDDTAHLPLEDPSTPKSSPKRPIPEKRTSVLGAIGKVFWPFGSSDKMATVMVTEIATERPDGVV